MEKTVTELQADHLSPLQDSEIKEVVKSLTREVDQMMAQLNKLQQQLPPLQEQYANKQATLNDLQSHCYHDEVGMLVDDSKKMSGQIMEGRKQVDTMDSQLEQLRCAVTSNVSSELVALRSQLTAKEELLQQLQQQILSVREQLHRPDDDATTLYQQLAGFVDSKLFSL